MQTKQTDDVRAVGVEVLTLAGAIETNLGSGSRYPLVVHVSEQCAGRILADGCAEVQAESEVRKLDLLRGEQIRREAPKEREAVAACQGVDDVAERRPQRGQRCIGAAESGDGATRGLRGTSDRDQLVSLVVGQLDGPFAGVGDIGRLPNCVGPDRRPLRVGGGHQQQRASASGTDAQHRASSTWSSTLTLLCPNESLSSSTV